MVAVVVLVVVVAVVIVVVIVSAVMLKTTAEHCLRRVQTVAQSMKLRHNPRRTVAVAVMVANCSWQLCVPFVGS